MYAVKQDGTFAGYADSIVPIRLHGNGCYVPCKEDQAEGFCAKMAVTLMGEDGNEYQVSNRSVRYALEQRDTAHFYTVAVHPPHKCVQLPIVGIALLPVAHPRRIN